MTEVIDRDAIAKAIEDRIKASPIGPPVSGQVGMPFAATMHDLADAVLAVAERSVRKQVAKEILDQETWLRGCVDFTANERQVGMINGYRLAARIAKGD